MDDKQAKTPPISESQPDDFPRPETDVKCCWRVVHGFQGTTTVWEPCQCARTTWVASYPTSGAPCSPFMMLVPMCGAEAIPLAMTFFQHLFFTSSWFRDSCQILLVSNLQSRSLRGVNPPFWGQLWPQSNYFAAYQERCFTQVEALSKDSDWLQGLPLRHSLALRCSVRQWVLCQTAGSGHEDWLRDQCLWRQPQAMATSFKSTRFSIEDVVPCRIPALTPYVSSFIHPWMLESFHDPAVLWGIVL